MGRPLLETPRPTRLHLGACPRSAPARQPTSVKAFASSVDSFFAVAGQDFKWLRDECRDIRHSKLKMHPQGSDRGIEEHRHAPSSLLLGGF